MPSSTEGVIGVKKWFVPGDGVRGVLRPPLEHPTTKAQFVRKDKTLPCPCLFHFVLEL